MGASPGLNEATLGDGITVRRDAAPFPSMALQMLPVSLPQRPEDDRRLSSVVVVPGIAAPTAVESRLTKQERTALVALGKAERLTFSEWAQAAEQATSTLAAKRQTLMAQDLVRQDGDHYLLTGRGRESYSRVGAQE